MRPAKDDPRMSRGLQLLQSKIAILEDLSDRTDNQVKQLNLLLDEKAKDVQRQIEAAQNQISAVHDSMRKSQEVAKIFQDKIPHEEIIDRNNTIKYVRAAQMAYNGTSIEEIERELQIPRSELEFIVKVNRDRLMFDPNGLPEWAKATTAQMNPTQVNPAVEKALREAFEPSPQPSESLAKIGEEFRKAVKELSPNRAPEPVQTQPTPAPTIIPTQTNKDVSSATIKPYAFPKITLRS